MRLVLICLLLLLPLPLTACDSLTERDPSYQVSYQGQTYLINPVDETISHGSEVYHFHVSNYETSITYPNGASYSVHSLGNSSTISYSETYDETAYVPGSTLLKVLSGGDQPRPERSGHPLAGLLLMGVGLWNTVSPRSSWQLSCGWRYRNAAPSELALCLTRGAGVLFLLLGLIAFVI